MCISFLGACKKITHKLDGLTQQKFILSQRILLEARSLISSLISKSNIHISSTMLRLVAEEDSSLTLPASDCCRRSLAFLGLVAAVTPTSGIFLCCLCIFTWRLLSVFPDPDFHLTGSHSLDWGPSLIQHDLIWAWLCAKSPFPLTVPLSRAWPLGSRWYSQGLQQHAVCRCPKNLLN